MDTGVEGPQEDGAQDLNLVDTPWTTENSHEIANNNSTYLYIAVEYVKDEFKMENGVSLAASADSFPDFEQHVSPLDPNMSSVARYSPVYNEPSSDYNPIVIHRLVQSANSAQNELIGPNLPVLCNDSQFLHMVNPPEGNVGQSGESELQIEPSGEQEVELLITDQETGISYTVKPQDFVVEPSLVDEQLLNTLSVSPDPLLDTHLLALDENTLKSELSDDVNSVSNYISSLSDSLRNSAENEQYKIETRRGRQVEEEEQLLSHVYNIIDKPILSRARASLPEPHLAINSIGDEFGVFVKKNIPKSTQFGPLTGILRPLDDISGGNYLDFLLVGQDDVVQRLDVSDENVSNWMSFVRKAENYSEQNLVISQEGTCLFFTTTRSIPPKQELKVGYSRQYATQHKLTILSPIIDESWPCFECLLTFGSSEELQQHLNVHDSAVTRTENGKARKKQTKVASKRDKKPNIDAVKCNDCNEMFIHPGKVALRHHLIEKHVGRRLESIEQYFTTVLNFKCENCASLFDSEALLKIHNFLHNSDSSEELSNHICPGCQRKFPTQRQLVVHVGTHALANVKIAKTETFKCELCHKIFAQRDRLRRHMMVHGAEENKPLQCKTCKKRFLNTSALSGHIKTHFVGKKVYECPICKERFDHVLKLKFHVTIHCENNTFSCPHCPKIFKKYNIIRKHIRAFHCDQKQTCPHCSKMFRTLDKLKMHMLRHSDHREFLCADCGKQFKRKDKLTEHSKRMHSEERENEKPPRNQNPVRRVIPKMEPTDFHRFIYKCHSCFIGFKRRGMLVNHLAKKHPDISPDSVPELNLPILQTTRDYYCQHCEKVYKSSSKRKAHILKNHPGAALPMSNRKGANFQGNPDPTFSQTVGSVTTRPQSCKWCHKQYASKAKLLQHQRKKHSEELANEQGFNVDGVSERCEEERVDEIIAMPKEEISLNDNNFKGELEILDGTLEILEDRENDQYCHLVAIADNADFVQSDLNNPSHLYRLLTTSSGMVPPR